MQSTVILGAGSNFFGQLGLGFKERNESEKEATFFGNSDESALDTDQVSDIQCGSQFTVVLTKNGSLNICGTLNGNVFPTLSPLEIHLPIKCVQVACGRRHVLLLMERGIVMSWGTGYFGQLGHGDDSGWDSPRMISVLEPKHLGAKVINVACGGSHSGVITDSGRVFMWGLNRSGQCGQGLSAKGKSDSVLEPRPVDFSHLANHGTLGVKSLVLGRNHSAMLSTTGRVFTWGEAGFGRLGLNDVKKTQLIPAEVMAFSKNPVTTLSAGDFHMLALTQDGQVYSWGYGVDGQTGHCVMLNVRCPRRIDFFDTMHIRDVCCGAGYSLVLTVEGALYSFGYGDGEWLILQPQRALPQVEIDALTPALAASLPESHAEICCFDSRYTVLRPRVVSLLNQYHVCSVRAGVGHTIVTCTRREGSAISNSGASEGVKGRNTGSDYSGAFGIPPLAPGKSPTYASAGAKSVSSKYDTKGTSSGASHATPLSVRSNLEYSDLNDTSTSHSNTPTSTSTNGVYPHMDHPSHPNYHKNNPSGSNSASNSQFGAQGISAKPSSNSGSTLDAAQVFSWVRHKKIPELTSYLSECSADSAVDSAGNTPLIVACQNGHFGVCKLLLAHGADLNASNHKGNTALHYCMNYGYEDIGNFLIENGADDFQTNAEGLTCYEGLTQSDLEAL